MLDKPTPDRDNAAAALCSVRPVPSPSTVPRATPRRHVIARPRLDPELLRSFRVQSHALGAVWICTAALYWVVVFAIFQQLIAEHGLLLLAPGLIPALFGVAILQKQLWAIRIATFSAACGVLSVAYRAFQANAPIALIAVIVPLPLLLQGWRVLDWAHQIRAAGFPLTAKPWSSNPS